MLPSDCRGDWVIAQDWRCNCCSRLMLYSTRQPAGVGLNHGSAATAKAHTKFTSIRDIGWFAHAQAIDKRPCSQMHNIPAYNLPGSLQARLFGQALTAALIGGQHRIHGLIGKH